MPINPYLGILGTSRSVISCQKTRTHSENYRAILSRNDASSNLRIRIVKYSFDFLSENDASSVLRSADLRLMKLDSVAMITVSLVKAKTGSFCREYPAVISATSDSQDSTDDRFRPEGYDISPTNQGNEHSEDKVDKGELQDISEDETSKTSSLPGLIIVMPERRKAVASKRT